MIKTFILTILAAFTIGGLFGQALGGASNAIQTIDARVPIVQDQLKNLPLDASSAVLPTDDYYVKATKQVRGRLLTGYEYDQLKTKMKNIISNRNAVNPSYEEAATWVELIKNCVIKNVNGITIDLINNSCL